MRSTAKRDGKFVPSHDALEALATESMDCPDCGVKMNWLSRDGNSTAASLQHYRDGLLAIVCRSCNSRHHHMPGDTYRDIPDGSQFCSACKAIKPSHDFSGNDGRKCNACGSLGIQSWCKRNRERYNAYHREYRAKIAANTK